jgi:signal transduction histidine kinase
VVRVNRVVEEWMHCDVREVIGFDMHNVLHRDCGEVECALQRAFSHAWLGLGDNPLEFEQFDELLARSIRIELKRMPSSELSIDGACNFAICVISDITQLCRAQEGQRILHQQLELRVYERTRELSAAVRGLRAEAARRELAETSLRTSRNELGLLSKQLMKAQENERKRIAQDLHDAVGQSLSAIKYSLERALQMLAAPHLGNPLAVLNKTVEHVQNTIEEVRTISENLRPAVLDGLGAVSAIRWLCREWNEVFSDIEVEIDLHVTDADINEPMGTALFRTIQESLNNIAQHAKASCLRISICRETDFLRADISDNGQGFDPEGEAATRGHGLRGIRERATLSGGEFWLTSYPGGGTQLMVTWPVSSSDDKEEAVLCQG